MDFSLDYNVIFNKLKEVEEIQNELPSLLNYNVSEIPLLEKYSSTRREKNRNIQIRNRLSSSFPILMKPNSIIPKSYQGTELYNELYKEGENFRCTQTAVDYFCFKGRTVDTDYEMVHKDEFDKVEQFFHCVIQGERTQQSRYLSRKNIVIAPRIKTTMNAKTIIHQLFLSEFSLFQPTLDESLTLERIKNLLISFVKNFSIEQLFINVHNLITPKTKWILGANRVTPELYFLTHITNQNYYTINITNQNWTKRVSLEKVCTVLINRNRNRPRKDRMGQLLVDVENTSVNEIPIKLLLSNPHNVMGQNANIIRCGLGVPSFFELNIANFNIRLLSFDNLSVCKMPENLNHMGMNHIVGDFRINVIFKDETFLLYKIGVKYYCRGPFIPSDLPYLVKTLVTKKHIYFPTTVYSYNLYTHFFHIYRTSFTSDILEEIQIEHIITPIELEMSAKEVNCNTRTLKLRLVTNNNVYPIESDNLVDFKYDNVMVSYPSDYNQDFLVRLVQNIQEIGINALIEEANHARENKFSDTELANHWKDLITNFKSPNLKMNSFRLFKIINEDFPWQIKVQALMLLIGGWYNESGNVDKLFRWQNITFKLGEKTTKFSWDDYSIKIDKTEVIFNDLRMEILDYYSLQPAKLEIREEIVPLNFLKRKIFKEQGKTEIGGEIYKFTRLEEKLNFEMEIQSQNVTIVEDTETIEFEEESAM